MRTDHDARLRLRRLAGVLGPVLLLPAAAWFYVVTPPSALADPVPGPGGAPPEASASAAPGVVVQVTARPDGALDVVETVRLAEPVAQLRLVPRDLDLAGAPFDTVEPVHSGVAVVVPGQDPLPVPEVGAGVTVPLVVASSVVEVRYTLEGATVRTVPGPPGRALAAVAPLAQGPGVPVGFELAGDPVRAVTCPSLPADAELCGTDAGGTLVVEPQPAATAVVVVQLDLDP